MMMRLRKLLFEDDDNYRHEAQTMIPTTLDRLAENRERLKQLRERKAKERLELVQHKYLQQARYGTARLMPGFHHSVAVLPLPFRRCRYENSVRIP